MISKIIELIATIRADGYEPAALYLTKEAVDEIAKDNANSKDDLLLLNGIRVLPSKTDKSYIQTTEEYENYNNTMVLRKPEKMYLL